MKKTKVHMIAICGMGMGTLAGYLKAKGFEVSGSDENVYPPMSLQMKELGVEIKKGYRPENIEPDTDFIIVGNAVKKDNPEVLSLLESGKPYFSLPGFFESEILPAKTSLVVAGTHGKTTLTSLLGWCLESMGEDPSVFVGGIVKKWDKSYRVGKGDYFVLEGDEYDSAFFDKVPKFLHYRPKNLILTGIEFDHADIYESLDKIQEEFKKLVSLVPADGRIAAFAENSTLSEVLEGAKCETAAYGFAKGDYVPSRLSYGPGGSSFDVVKKGRLLLRCESLLIGRQNVLNALGTIALLDLLGFEPERIRLGLKTFPGVKRRQEKIAEVGGVSVIDDFAHHPTAIALTIEGFRLSYPKSRIIAVFEPRTNTSRRNFFQNELSDSFSKADKVIIGKVYKDELLKKEEALDVGSVIDEMKKNGRDARYIPDVDEIVDVLSKEVKRGDIILLMSNGAFGGIYEKLLTALEK